MNKAKLGGFTLALLLALGPTPWVSRAADAERPRAPAGAVLVVDRSDDTNVTTCGVAASDCTLRGAINKINLSGVGQEIQFAPAITQVNLTAPLPVITTTGTVIMGVAGAPRINAAGIATGFSFRINTSNARISGLTLFNGSTVDIEVESGTGNQIDGNFLGMVSPSATTCGGPGYTRNAVSGIVIREASSASGGTAVWIHGNTIVCHGGYGIASFGGDDAQIGLTPVGAADGNWIGTTLFKMGGGSTGLILPNGIGIYLSASGSDGARRNVIRNNVIANSDSSGVALQGNGTNDTNSTSANTIAGNAIIGNGNGTPQPALWLLNGAFWNVIGGAADGDGNTIGGNRGVGVSISDSDLNGILGNTIGADDFGLGGNLGTGLYITGSASTWVGGIFLLLGAAERGNVIAGNGQNGVWMTAGAHGTTVSRNWIGNTPEGTLRPNQFNGVLIDNGAYSNTVGTGSFAQHNVIGGNNGDGVAIAGSATMSNAVRNNDIGLNSLLSLASRALPNDYGIVIRNGAHDNTVADSNWIAENRNAGVWLRSGAMDNRIGPNNDIFNNDADGIAISDAATAFNTVLSSTIYSNRGDGIREYVGATNNAWVATRTYANSGLGIDKVAESSATNIPSAGWPVITSVVRSGGNVTLTGMSDAAVGGIFGNTTRVFVFSGGLDPSGYGEGQTFVGDAATDSNGVWRLSYTEGATPRCYSAYKRSFGFFLSSYDYGSEFSPSTCVPKLAYLPRTLR
jgi:hypothetical protein